MAISAGASILRGTITSPKTSKKFLWNLYENFQEVFGEPLWKLLRSSLKTSEKFWENYKTSEKFSRTLYENIPRSFHRSSLKTFLKFLLSLENFLGVFNEDLKLPGSFRWSLKTSPKFSGRFENFSEVYGAAWKLRGSLRRSDSFYQNRCPWDAITSEKLKLLGIHNFSVQMNPISGQNSFYESQVSFHPTPKLFQMRKTHFPNLKTLIFFVGVARIDCKSDTARI